MLLTMLVSCNNGASDALPRLGPSWLTMLKCVPITQERRILLHLHYLSNANVTQLCSCLSCVQSTVKKERKGKERIESPNYHSFSSHPPTPWIIIKDIKNFASSSINRTIKAFSSNKNTHKLIKGFGQQIKS